jgi:intracellular septation protein
MKNAIIGGLLPIIAYTIVEEMYGAFYGLIAGMVLGIFEVLYEYKTQKKVETITWISNALVIGLGCISLFTNEGFWFKMQPALIEFAMAIFLMVSYFLKKPLLLELARKQGMLEKINPEQRPVFENSYRGLTFRIGVFFILHSFLATYAALYWSTASWALLKGVGFTGSMVVYMIVEVFLIRRKIVGINNTKYF